ncbi:HAMP domain-containing sensor histidine kinase [Thermoactinomyces sp. DSM 45892]|uniref:sensor histidine kinase n=1 Tax=Thermoactinomyces sp. DSM 45892 TaxID=1882753 RepID=UPI00089BF59C|nr:HAMP domain-containing sensor histidine kinase [Thermoactinomyces sp. DSM 45892]SDY53391.1 Signal transduction histidine kinase [Thermoactinomyces sp. DSM 45892]
MKKGIVFKLFLFTTGLCMLIIATIFIGQTVFFERYYESQKETDLKERVSAFRKKYVEAKGDFSKIRSLEQGFYRDYAIWITTLDQQGNMKYANDFSIEVEVQKEIFPNLTKYPRKMIRIPMYHLVHVDDEKSQSNLVVGNHITIRGVEKDNIFTPSQLFSTKDIANEQLAGKLDKLKQTNFVVIRGTIKEVHFPKSDSASSFIYTNRIFLERMKRFQSSLITTGSLSDRDGYVVRNHGQGQYYVENYEESGVTYKVLTQPILDPDGKTNYLFAMTSLQPVNEAVQMIKGYYVYLIILVLLLTILLSFYYSKQIARPLLQINETTKKIAHLDFSEMISVDSKDEIGDLSTNINELSNKLQSYIEKLQDEIEKEKQLENTRKEFIAGVSHELETPLSIMKSCVSILRDGVATHKKDHYFNAMEKEVDKMDLLIVDMLELAKFESGTYKLEMQSFYIDESMDQICDQLIGSMENKHLQIEKNLHHVKVMANQSRIEQVLTNFITNAIRYTPEGERIVTSTIIEKGCVKVCVENKGAHIPQAQLDKIWERFYRADAARQRSTGGTGLGLSISKKILELHGAPYGVQNTKDGVLFYFYLTKVKI